MTYALLPWTLPLYLQGHVIALLTVGWAWWGRPTYQQGMLLCPWRPGFKWGQHWTTTLATWMGHRWDRRPSITSRLWFHEVMVHGRQYEDMCVLGALIGGVCCFWSWELGLGIWLSSGPLWYAPGYVTALPRYWRAGREDGLGLWEIAYRGHEIERSAYAQDDDHDKDPWE